MFGNIGNIGEKTINKIAEMAFATQIKGADKLSVKIKTDRNNLAKGILESLAIDSEGLITQTNLRMQGMKITLKSITVNPWQALMGNVQLTQPSQGSACVVLSEADIQTALNIDNLNQQLQKYSISLDSQPVRVKFNRFDCRILANGKVAVEAKIRILETGLTKSICLNIQPRVCTTGKGISLEAVECTEGEELSPILIEAILAEAEQIFNLSYFKIEGISLDVHQLNIEEGKLNLLAAAGITHLPSA